LIGYRLVAWQCGYEFNPSRFKDFILSRFIPGFDHHLCYHTNAKLYALRYGASDDQVTVIHNTINDAKIRVIPKAEARKEIFSLFPQIGEKKILLFVGAILEEKRLDMVLDALDLLRREDLVFLVVGDGPYMEKVRRMSQNRTDVVLAGAVVDGVGTYFDAADIFVLPGTGGLAINEAMAHSLPIVSGYADGSADDLVIDGVNGYRLRSSSPGELADRIGNLLSQPAKMTMMGQASRQMITEKFSYQKFIDTVCQALENI
jgi:glycosyltransferase involved in cell wall biosynthesis